MMKSRLTLLFIVLLCFFYSCKKDSSPAVQPTKPDQPADSTKNNTASPLLAMANAVRKTGCTCGTTAMPAVGPLVWNDKLATAAVDHSTDMNTNNYFSHTGLDGSSPGDRITATGYIWTSYGENIAYNYPDEQSVMNGWLQSEGHCKNIMGAGFTEMGSGHVGGYWTEDFGSR